jgi:hypothetical protein
LSRLGFGLALAQLPLLESALKFSFASEKWIQFDSAGYGKKALRSQNLGIAADASIYVSYFSQ